MKQNFLPALAAALTGIFSLGTVLAQPSATPFVYESPRELFGQGDFDGDGRPDAVIVDKESGKLRLGYQTSPGMLLWVDNRPSGIKGVSGISLGRFSGKGDAIALTSPDANQLTLVDVSSTTASARPTTIPFDAALGPNTVVALDIGGPGNTPAPDFYVGSIYNSPEPNQATLLRNDGKEYATIQDIPLPGAPLRGNRIVAKPGEFLSLILSGDAGDALQIQDFKQGKPMTAAAIPDLPKGSDYAVGSFRGAGTLDLVIYKPGDAKIQIRPLEEAGAQVKLGPAGSYDLGQPVRRIITLPQSEGQRLIVIFGNGEKAGLYQFDGKEAPSALQTFVATNDLFTAAVPVEGGFVMFTQTPEGKFSTRYQLFKGSGNAYAATAFGGLPTLADNDNITIPDIHNRIVSNHKAKVETDMQFYTNVIPGTRVSYVMVPIKGGEYVMGSPDAEANRKPDEGPQHKVRVSPFWMGRCEVTWNEYELFMYPDEEKRIRATVATDAAGDKLADAVSHPSKPYVEMSFGMGKDGFPAISMTQHAANKYCQWLSAKTGHFYRLPTEAEWEYACRAGTKTAYYFGDDESQLPEHGWFEQNSDFKYQKVGKKKPNPWGLYDMCGNVVEWMLDQYDAEYYKQCVNPEGVVVDPWNRATKAYPHAVRGGSWDDEASRLRSGARRGSDRSWKMQDPQLPKSIWFFSDAQFLGFRIVRPLKVPPPEDMQKYWSNGVERD